ncbi:hypothetical protein [Aeropyrum pernix]|uniref:hypothetical protein n=1 Tax=Aeropyrum pernix TaxID=56636 RepID=UPI0010377790|nr:hypothetical protein [Aeropyrum pernix]
MSGSIFVVSLDVYEVNIDRDKLVAAMESLSEHCRNWSNESAIIGSPKCGVVPQAIVEYAREGKLAIVAVVAKVSNSGPGIGRVGGPGPYCGHSYNLDHLEDPSRDPLKRHYKPLSGLSYKVKYGEVVLGYGGFCQLAMILHPLYPGGSLETTYGLIVAKPAELEFAIDPFLISDNIEERAEVNITVKIS